jgi:hypothetical protein
MPRTRVERVTACTSRISLISLLLGTTTLVICRGGAEEGEGWKEAQGREQWRGGGEQTYAAAGECTWRGYCCWG